MPAVCIAERITVRSDPANTKEPTMSIRKPSKVELRHLRRNALCWSDILRAEYMLNGLDRKTCRGRLQRQIKAGLIKKEGRGSYRVV